MMLIDRSVGELKARLMIVNQIAREAQANRDPRCAEAQRQARRLNVALAAKQAAQRQQAGIPDPPAVVIGMKPARLKAERLLAG